ncbi:membrane proteins related to metalloendopeptidases [Aquipluma nitroreducens]|uniref:Membrane proteins related to metalloendopeptidases n=1 Tax=Aquipluma nitroreducens TaxID=2010828 RepID=A0A5K7S7R0_9BACT|nr:M23 family metallopeptidase [Aquipluma nitroreducens]BBE17593.1 membrane proteins related to metalloendopeptidases [Aquipluma nitroreducens]
MNRKEFRKKIFQMLKDHYRLIIYNDSSIQTVWSIKLTPLKVLTLGSIGAILLILFTTVIIAYTPLRENIPGYPSAKVRQQIIYNYILVDSLENEIKNRDSYFEKIKTLFQGDVPLDESSTPSSGLKTYDVKFKNSNADSIFQDKLLEEKLNLSVSNNSKKLPSISNIHFFTPLRGLITNKFDTKTEHFAVDIVGSPNSRISSVLDGTVVFAGWTMNTGYSIYIQHENNLISAYKHNAELLKEVGDKVKAGDAIAIMGNSGELTTGPHLHFELWHNGTALDPETYIDF